MRADVRPFFVMAIMLVGVASGSDGWSRFRGPNGAGVAAGHLPAKWTERDYSWKTPLPGPGHSSPVIWGDKIFVTCGADEDQLLVVCLDRKSGRELWVERLTVSKTGRHKLNSLASSTPAADDKHVYVGWGCAEYVLVVALDHAGNEAWRQKYDGFRTGHGYGISLAVYGDLVVLPNEHQGDSSLLALDCRDGTIRWELKRDSKLNYATPCLRRSSGGVAELIFVNWTQGVTAVDLERGRTRWAADVFDKSHVESAIGSPVLAGDLVIAVCGWLGHGNEVVAVRPPQGERQQAKRVWRIDRGAPLCTTPLVRDDLLFLWSDNGIVTCAAVESGDVVWQKRVGGNYYSSPICIGDRIYNVSTTGQMVVLAAAREYQLLGRNDLGEASQSTPAVADGVMYLRTLSHLMALGPRDP